MRDGLHENFLRITEAVAYRSTCIRAKVGATVVDQYNHIVSTGYNGAPVDTPHCIDREMCLRVEYNIPSGTRYELCNSVHAEANALLQAGRLSYGGTLYVVSLKPNNEIFENYPCMMCSRLILNSHIYEVVVGLPNDEYKKLSPEEVYSMSHSERGIY